MILTAEPLCLSFQEPGRRALSASIQNENQDVFIVYSVVINIWENRKNLYTRALLSEMEGGLSQSKLPHVQVLIFLFQSSEIGKISSEYERGTNTLPVVNDRIFFENSYYLNLPGNFSWKMAISSR